MPLSLSQVVKILNSRLNHTMLIIYKNGREQKMKGSELKQKLMTGKIKLDELKDIQDLNILERRFKPMPAPKIITKKYGGPMYSPYNNSFKPLKLLTGLAVLIVILKVLRKR
ncbi:hypothetical protein JCM16138_15930 [Thermococcus atlanticus]